MRIAGSVEEAAGILGISRKNLWEKMRKLGLHPPEETAAG
jgi:DNA-binding NtrC family response regulator